MNEERPSDRNGERDSQLSAMFDGELSAAECELLARRLARDEVLRAQWSRYALVGAALRAERGVKLHDRVASRVQVQVALEAAYGDVAAVDMNSSRPAAARTARTASVGDRWMRFARPMFGAGIAAGVAATSILWLRSQEAPETLLVANPVPETVTLAPETVNSTIGPTLALNPVQTVTSEPASNGEPFRYSTPAPSNQRSVAPPARLANYVVAHSEYSGPLSRRLALLGLVGSDGAVDAAPTDDSTPASGTQSDAH